MRALLIAIVIEWATLGTWSGDGIKGSPSFETSAREWRIIWTVQEGFAPGLASLTVQVIDAKTDAFVAVAGSTTSAGTDTTYVRTPPGRYYLRMLGTTPWKVTVQEER